jgi:hypothetical protein
VKNQDALYRLAPREAHGFIDSVISFCLIHSLGLEVVEEEHVTIFGSECAGSFSARNDTLSIAVGVPFEEWFPVLAHEFGHANQYVDDRKKFRDMDVGSDRVFEWTGGKEFTTEELDKAFSDAIWLESDCEARTVKAINTYRLNDIIEVNEYAQKGNAYAQFYQHLRNTRTWYVTGKCPYTLSEVWSLFPTTVFVGTMPLTHEQTAAFAACCVPNETNEKTNLP